MLVTVPAGGELDRGLHMEAEMEAGMEAGVEAGIEDEVTEADLDPIREVVKEIEKEEEIEEETREVMIVAEMTQEVTTVIRETDETSKMTDVEREETRKTAMMAVDHHQDTREMIEMSSEAVMVTKDLVAREVTETWTIEATLMKGSTKTKMPTTQRMSRMLSETTITKKGVVMRAALLTTKSRSMWTPKRKKLMQVEVIINMTINSMTVMLITISRPMK